MLPRIFTIVGVGVGYVSAERSEKNGLVTPPVTPSPAEGWTAIGGPASAGVRTGEAYRPTLASDMASQIRLAPRFRDCHKCFSGGPARRGRANIPAGRYCSFPTR